MDDWMRWIHQPGTCIGRLVTATRQDAERKKGRIGIGAGTYSASLILEVGLFLVFYLRGYLARD